MPRPVFDGKDAIELDTAASCVHAYERAPIVDGRYVFKNLTEGSYIIRAFASDGTFADVDEPLVKTIFDAINAERPKILPQADERIQRRESRRLQVPE